MALRKTDAARELADFSENAASNVHFTDPAANRLDNLQEVWTQLREVPYATDKHPPHNFRVQRN